MHAGKMHVCFEQLNTFVLCIAGNFEYQIQKYTNSKVNVFLNSKTKQKYL